MGEDWATFSRPGFAFYDVSGQDAMPILKAGRRPVIQIKEKYRMSEFNKVTVIREANVYFDGKVTSRTVILEDGSKKTLGFMMAGEYSFDTGVAEVMEVIGGAMDVQLPGSTVWQTVQSGESFDVPANSTFKLVVKQYADYCCAYLED